MEGQRQFRDRERRRQRAMSPQLMMSERSATSGLSTEQGIVPRVASPRLTMARLVILFAGAFQMGGFK